MATVLVAKAIDRSKYPNMMMFVDADGNICGTDRPVKMSEAEKAANAAQRKKDMAPVTEALKRMTKDPTPANVQAYQDAKAAFEARKASGRKK